MALTPFLLTLLIHYILHKLKLIEHHTYGVLPFTAKLKHNRLTLFSATFNIFTTRCADEHQCYYNSKYSSVVANE